MWLDKIIEAKEAKGITTKQMAERIKTLPEETIRRILSGKTKTPRIDTVLDLGASVGLSSHEIFEESTAYVGGESLKALQAELDTLKNERESIIAENKSLKEEVTSLSHENDILKIKLELKEEIILTHKYYIKKLN
jgi:transcriptional regulator with XRE-family HTH domain